MRRRVCVGFTLCLALSVGLPVRAQFTAEEIAQREALERFLQNAEIIDSKQMSASEGVTRPYKLTLQDGEMSRYALCKNPQGRVQGFWEGWKYEIAAYRMDKYLDLNMVPPTVERRFLNSRGSCQLWVGSSTKLLDMASGGMNLPPERVPPWSRAVYMQRAFDNLIANDDRHQGNILVTEDWRMILIDHSRSFRTGKRHKRKLIFSAKGRHGPKLMRQLPRAFVDKIEALDAGLVKDIVGNYLTDREIRALLARRELILAEIDRLIQQDGEDQVLY